MDWDKIQDAMPSDAREVLDVQVPYDSHNFFLKLIEMIQTEWQKQKPSLHQIVTPAMQALCLAALCQIFIMTETAFSKHLTVIAGVLGLIACSGPSLLQMLHMTRKTLDELSSFSNVLLPVVAATAYSSGNTVSAASTYSLTLFFSNLLWDYSNSILFPVLSGCLCFTLTDTALQQSKLKKLCNLANSFLSVSLRTIVYAFTGVISIATVITGNRDAAVLKALQFSISASVPVIGGIISDAASSLLSGAAFLKSSLGAYGMLAILSVLLIPFFRLLLSYLLFKGISAFIGIWDQSFTGLTDGIACIYGYMLAVLGSSAYLSILACCNLIRMVHVT